MADSSFSVPDREFFLAEPHVAQVAIYLRPERWLTADLGPGAVPPER
jgi:hypothetical protein